MKKQTTNTNFKIYAMKKLFYIFTLAFFILSSCSSTSDTEDSNSEVLIIGKWNLNSDKFKNGDVLEESITLCQFEFWQFDFSSTSNLTFRGTSDDPTLEYDECDPVFANYTYLIENNILTMIPNETNLQTSIIEIEDISNSKLVLGTLDKVNFYRQFTFDREH